MTVALQALRMLSVTAAELAALEATVDRHSVDHAAGLRAAIILKCVVEGSENEVSKLMDVKPAQVRKWRQRWEESGLDGLRARRPPRRRDLLGQLRAAAARRLGAELHRLTARRFLAADHSRHFLAISTLLRPAFLARYSA